MYVSDKSNIATRMQTMSNQLQYQSGPKRNLRFARPVVGGQNTHRTEERTTLTKTALSEVLSKPKNSHLDEYLAYEEDGEGDLEYSPHLERTAVGFFSTGPKQQQAVGES